MESWMNKWQTWVIAALVGIVAIWYLSGGARAADLGGNCCADLEERIAELEATVARKGNRKVSVTVYGQVNKGLLWQDDISGSVTPWMAVGGVKTKGPSSPFSFGSNKYITDNSSSPSFFGVAGSARINSDWKAGYVLEIGVGDYDLAVPGYDSNGIYVDRSFVYLKSAKIGMLSIGKNNEATDQIDQIDLAETTVVFTPLSIKPIIGPNGPDIFDGTTANIIRYDSPTFAGFVVSASWGATDDADGEDTWGVALRYMGEFQQVKVAAGVGYARGKQDLPLPDKDTDTYSAALSIMHAPSGVFVTANYGKGESDIAFFGPMGLSLEADGWAVKGGVKAKAFAAGKTTGYVEYGVVKGDGSVTGIAPMSWGGDVELTYYGGGLIQSIDAAALDLYAGLRWYDLDAGLHLCATSACDNGFGLDAEADTIIGIAGARIKF